MTLQKIIEVRGLLDRRKASLDQITDDLARCHAAPLGLSQQLRQPPRTGECDQRTPTSCRNGSRHDVGVLGFGYRWPLEQAELTR
jgi:hypothetical protein